MINESTLFFFTEQFANSPFINRISKEQVNNLYSKSYELIQRGINENVLADIDHDIILIQLYSPLLMFIKHMNKIGDEIDKKMVDTIFELSWKAVKK
jgi:hypothetical protein